VELLTAQELARELKITVDTVWRYTRTGRIPGVRLGARDYRYRLPEVMAALACASTPEENGAGPPPAPRHADAAVIRAFAGKLPVGGRR
jgi:excisionase family DNA binding protein